MAIDPRTKRLAAGVIGLSTTLGAAAEGLDEIVVTAQRREESLQTVPVAISAFDASAIAERSLQNVGEIANFAPNVIRGSGPSTGDDAFFFFRGVGQLDNSANVEPGVGVYVDDVYLGRVQGASFDVLDVERIEVLRGPQGTLFGRNTIGGAVNVTTRDPGKEFGGQFRLVGGDRDHLDALLSLDVPLGDRAGMIVSAFSRNQEGWAENFRNGDTFGDREDIGARVKLVWDANDALEVKLTADYNKGKGTALPTVLLATSVGPGGPFFGIPQPADIGTEIDTSPYDDRITQSIDPDMDSERSGASLHLNWNLGPARLKSITSYRQMEQEVWTDLDGSAYSIYDFQFVVDSDQLSQEFQLSGGSDQVEWLVGAFYYEEDLLNHTTAGVGTNTGGGFLAFPPPPPGFPFPGIPFYNAAQRLDGRSLNFQSNFFQDTTSYAGFGQVTFHFTEKLSGTLGLRYTRDEKDVSLDNYSDNTDSVFSPVCYLPVPPSMQVCAREGQILYTASSRPGSTSQLAGLATSFSGSWSETTPKVGFEYQATEDFMAYVSWSNGFKAGGFQGRATPLNDAPSFKPETLETYEIGFKSELADNRVRLNAAAFFTKYKDTQMLVADPVNGTFVTANGGDSEIKGIEVELLARPVEGLDLSFAGGWLDDEYTRLDPSTAFFGPFQTLAYTPEWTFALGAQYRWSLGDLGGLALRADYNWRDDFYYQAATNPIDLQEAFGLLDLRATWTSASEKLSIAAFGRNVTDEEYFGNLSDQRFGIGLGVALATLAPPADYGVELAYRF